jgi:hypothetical protein
MILRASLITYVASLEALFELSNSQLFVMASSSHFAARVSFVKSSLSSLLWAKLTAHTSFARSDARSIANRA